MSRITEKRKRIVYDKYNGCCAYCGQSISFKEMQPDHIVPLATLRAVGHSRVHEFGIRVADEVGNLNPSCADCNRYKRDLSVEAFRAYLLKRFSALCLEGMYRMAAKYGGKMTKPKAIVFHFEKVQQ